MQSGAQVIIQCLERHGVRVIAGMPGGANLPLYDALASSRIQHVLVRHEQAAGFIAQGMARVSGRAGVCFATSGPGATNLVTALADARMDSVPVVAITGQVPTALLGTDAFQEVDTVSIMAPVVKAAWMVRCAADLPSAIDRAFMLAQSGRPGPVLLDVPKDVQQARVTCTLPQAATVQLQAPHAMPSVAPEQLARIAELLAAAERPVLYVGGGVALAGAQHALAQLASRQDIAVACTLMGLGCFDPDDPQYLGMLGMHAAPYTNLLMRESDLLLAIGARFDDRATGKPSEFCPHAKTIHVDIDARELGKLRALDLGIAADARSLLEPLLQHVQPQRRPTWRARIAQLRARHPLPFGGGQRAHELLRTVASQLPLDTVVTTDVGQHQMWVAQLFAFRRPRQLLTSGGLGSMGFGLPAAIGAALASGGRVLCVSGDASLLLNIHELATLAELDLDVTVLVLDNRHLGLVRQQQMLFYGQRLSASHLPRATDFVAVARGLGVDAISLAHAPDACAALPSLLARRGPLLIHAPIDADTMVLPMVPPGAGNHEMIGA